MVHILMKYLSFLNHNICYDPIQWKYLWFKSEFFYVNSNSQDVKFSKKQ